MTPRAPRRGGRSAAPDATTPKAAPPAVDEGPLVATSPAVAASSPMVAPPSDAQRIDRMIDAVHVLSRRLAETQELLTVVSDRLVDAVAQLGEAPGPGETPTRPRRSAVGTPVRRPDPPPAVDPDARPVPPAPLTDHLHAPGEEPPPSSVPGPGRG